MKIKSKQFLVIGSLLSGLGVAIGAIGSHALKDFLMEHGRTETFEIAVRYQLYHGLALLVIGILSHLLETINFSLIGFLIFTGVICFSGSLYILSLSEAKWVVFITPLGGILMISGWLIFFVKLIKSVK